MECSFKLFWIEPFYLRTIHLNVSKREFLTNLICNYIKIKYIFQTELRIHMQYVKNVVPVKYRKIKEYNQKVKRIEK